MAGPSPSDGFDGGSVFRTTSAHDTVCCIMLYHTASSHPVSSKEKKSWYCISKQGRDKGMYRYMSHPRKLRSKSCLILIGRVSICHSRSIVYGTNSFAKHNPFPIHLQSKGYHTVLQYPIRCVALGS